MQGESRMAKQGATLARAARNRVLGAMAMAVAVGLGAGTAQGAPADIYRFYHLDAGRHFYTASTAERDTVMRLYPRFAYEGPRFQAYLTQESGTVPVYRFYHQGNGSHVYSASEAEKSTILQNYPIYAYEGIAFYAESNGNKGAVPVLRLYNTKLGTHFFTTSASEASYAVNTWPWFVLEGPMFYVRESGGNPPGNNVAPVATLALSAQTVAAGSSVTLTSTATDPDGTIAKVDFYQGTAKIGTVATAPYSMTHTFMDAGTFMIGAVATDNLGAAGAAPPIQLTVTAASGGGGGGNPPPPPPPTGGNTPPTVSLAASSTAITTGGSTVLTANASDPDGTIARVMFYNGGTLLNTDTTAPYTYSFTPSAAGSYTLTAVAVDNLNAQTNSNTVTVVATNPVSTTNLPRITLSLNNTLLNGSGTVNLTGSATATATGATVARVSFFMNGTKLVDDTTTPYTFTATIPGPGTYQIYAQAQDSLGNINNTLTQTVVAQTVPAPITPDADAWRLLNQATFGASQAEVLRVQSLGISGWINDQFTKPISGYPDTKYNRIQLATSADCTTAMPGGGNYPGDSPQARCARDHLTLAGVQRDFFLNAVYGADQLRQRVAWALSQIVVTSAAEQDLSYAHVMSRYQNIMFEEAFGNYEDLLRRVTYNPAMGNYLDMVNNDKTNGTTRVPNENYAREIMQLFSIGLEELNADGTPLLDAQGKPIPTYGQAEIGEFARVFTGYTYSSAANPNGPATGKQARYYGHPMIPYPATGTTGHDTGAKTLLNGTVLPANQTPQTDVDAAVRNVFMHPNTGPYVGKQLIQRLVTGNPSPAYVGRVAAVFADNGAGVRGDLQAVVRAILLDPEARGPSKTAADYGSLKEPVLMATGLLRALSGVTDGSRLEGATNNLGQRPYYAPTVFNYFPPDQTIPGTSVLGPEFAIHTTNSAVARANLVYTLVYNGYPADATIPDSPGTRLFLAQFEALATTPAAMVSEINKVLAGGLFPAALEPTIVTAVNAVPISATPTAQQRTDRVRMAVYLMASSYDYQVQR